MPLTMTTVQHTGNGELLNEKIRQHAGHFALGIGAVAVVDHKHFDVVFRKENWK